MNILAPTNRPDEVVPLIKEGADEFYCGLMPRDWKEKYTNMASMNRREWKVSNIEDINDLKEIVDLAHTHGKRVYLTMNALYSEEQYPLVLENTMNAIDFGIDALIVADIGFILTLKEMDIDIELHISTGGTVFNVWTARFFKQLGGKRVIFPRHVKVEEAIEIARNEPSMHFEMFILNRGCKNIDGFCTFHHGVNEVRKGAIWDIPKKMNLDQKILSLMRRFPEEVAKPLLVSDFYGSVGACFLNYHVEPEVLIDTPPDRVKSAVKNIKSQFNLLSGIDTCGACRLRELKDGSIHSVKIVGRENLTEKKLKDTRFLRRVLDYIEDNEFVSIEEEEKNIMKIYKKVYGFDCGRRCYYPR